MKYFTWSLLVFSFNKAKQRMLDAFNMYDKNSCEKFKTRFPGEAKAHGIIIVVNRFWRSFHCVDPSNTVHVKICYSWAVWGNMRMWVKADQFCFPGKALNQSKPKACCPARVHHRPRELLVSSLGTLGICKAFIRCDFSLMKPLKTMRSCQVLPVTAQRRGAAVCPEPPSAHLFQLPLFYFHFSAF